MPRRILVVEDNDDNRAWIVKFLEHRGFTVTSAATVQGAIAALTAGESPDWILLDLMLPDGNGSQVMEWMQSHNSRSHVAVMSGGAPAALAEAAKMHPDAIMKKPALVEDFIELLGQSESTGNG